MPIRFGHQATPSQPSDPSSPSRFPDAVFVVVNMVFGDAPARASRTRQNTWLAFSPGPYCWRLQMRRPVSSHMRLRVVSTGFAEVARFEPSA